MWGRQRRPAKTERVARRQIWTNGRAPRFLDPDDWRRDRFGSLIYFDHYRDRTSEFGWEKAHFEPLHWRNADRSSDDFDPVDLPRLRSAMSAIT